MGVGHTVGASAVVLLTSICTELATVKMHWQLGSLLRLTENVTNFSLVFWGANWLELEGQSCIPLQTKSVGQVAEFKFELKFKFKFYATSIIEAISKTHDNPKFKFNLNLKLNRLPGS